jgi:nucleotide-binding universal stress UspA family protein
MNATATRTKIELKNVLFATDFSDTAAAAMPYAKTIAKAYGAHLFVLHVMPPAIDPMTSPETWARAGEANRIQSEECRQELRDEFADFRPDILMPEGDIRALLPLIVSQKKIDLVVIGTRGRSGVKKFFLGSVAEELFREISCPMLTVGPHASAPVNVNEVPRQILYATNFSAQAGLAAAFAVSLAEEFQADLTLTHCVAGPSAGELVNKAQLENHFREQLRSLVPAEAESCCKVEYVVKEGDAAEGILEAARERNVNLIVLGVHPETGFPGASTHLPMATAHKVVSHANCPVLTIRH